MENKVKGTQYDVGNNRWYHGDCCDDYQYHRHGDQHYTELQGNINIKKATALFAQE